jgi:tetratricopeptide (TPR) repeat protein
MRSGLTWAFLFVLTTGTVAACRQSSPPVAGADQAATRAAQQLDPELLKAKSIFDGGNVTDAEQLTRQYLQSHPASADGHFLLGLILFKQNKPKDSLAEYTEGAKYRDPSAYDLEVVSLNYVLIGDYMDADKWLTKSVGMDSHNWQTWYYLGRTKYNENRFAEAIQAFEQCLKLSPENVKAQDNLGLSYAGLGRPQDAEAAYRKAISWQAQLLEQNPGPYLNLGILLVEQNHPEQALEYLQRAVQISPDDPKGHENLGRAYERLNQLSNAQPELEKAVAAKPDDPALHYVLGQIYKREGLSEKAKVEFDTVEKLNAAKHSNRGNQPTAAIAPK